MVAAMGRRHRHSHHRVAVRRFLPPQRSMVKAGCASEGCVSRSGWAGRSRAYYQGTVDGIGIPVADTPGALVARWLHLINEVVVVCVRACLRSETSVLVSGSGRAVARCSLPSPYCLYVYAYVLVRPDCTKHAGWSGLFTCSLIQQAIGCSTKAPSTALGARCPQQRQEAIAEAVSGWKSPGSRGLDSLIGKVAGQEMGVSEKGDRSLGPKRKRPSPWAPKGQIALPAAWRTGELGADTTVGHGPGEDGQDAFAIANAGIGMVGDGGRHRLLGRGPLANKPGPDVDMGLLYRDQSTITHTRPARHLVRPDGRADAGGGAGGGSRPLCVERGALPVSCHVLCGRARGRPAINTSLHLALESRSPLPDTVL